MTTQAEKEMDITMQGGLKSGDLRKIIQRIENLNTQKQGIVDDIKAEKDRAKSEGFNVKTINSIVKLRSRDEREIEEEEILIDLYKRALGMS